MRSRDDSRDYGTTGHADGPLQLLPTEESQNTVKKLFVKKLSVKVMNAGGRAACHQIETRLGLAPLTSSVQSLALFLGKRPLSLGLLDRSTCQKPERQEKQT